MAEIPSKTTRVVVLLASLGLAASAILWRVLRTAPAAEMVVVDATQPLNELLEKRGVPDSARVTADAPYPPPLVREPLDEATAKKFFGAIGNQRYVYDERLIYRCTSNLAMRQEFDEHPDGGWMVRTNSLGMREDGEPSAEQPDLRILVAGASNVEAMCANAESATNLLEASLRERLGGESVEVLNAGAGSSNFYNYVAVLERYRELAPDVFVVIVYGGTDFANGLAMERYFNRRGPWRRASKSCEPLARSGDPFVRQLHGTELGSVVRLSDSPEDFQSALDLACTIGAALDDLSRADGIRLICVYLPPPLASQPELLARERDEALQLVGLTGEHIAVTDRLAERWLAFLRERGVECLDLRPTWRASKERLYWRTDTHINLAGQRAIADALLALIEPR